MNADQFFSDCAREGLEPNDAQLRAWLWFTCPAQMRAELSDAIKADARYRGTVTCSKCGHTWTPNHGRPTRCANPRCRSPYWDRPKKGG